MAGDFLQLLEGDPQSCDGQDLKRRRGGDALRKESAVKENGRTAGHRASSLARQIRQRVWSQNEDRGQSQGCCFTLFGLSFPLCRQKLL